MQCMRICLYTDFKTHICFSCKETELRSDCSCSYWDEGRSCSGSNYRNWYRVHSAYTCLCIYLDRYMADITYAGIR